MKNKKICCITTVDITLEIFVIEAMRQFVDKGYEVTLVCSMSSDFQEKYGKEFRCVNIPMKRGISVSDLFKMPFLFKSFFKQEKFDMIQYATPNASLYASIGGWMAKVPVRLYCQWGIRYVGLSGIMRKVIKLLEHITCKLSTDICPASQKNLDFAVKEGLYKAEKAIIIGNGGTIGVDLSKFDLSKKKELRDYVLREYPILKNKIVFCSVGRLSRDKGSFELLEAFGQLMKERDDVALMMIGDIEGNIPEHLDIVCKNKNVVFTGFTKDVFKYMSACDILVHPSYREGFSMVIQEAMAMELAVLTTDIPGPSEVIEKDITGLLVEPKSTESLLAGMHEILTDKNRIVKMGIAGRKRCEHLFNRQRMLRLTYEHRIKLMSK